MKLAEHVRRSPVPAVQLGTRISLESRLQLDAVLAAENIQIRTVIEDAIFERWSRIKGATDV